VSPFLFVFAPVVGYYTGRALHKDKMVRSVKQKLLEEGDLRSILLRWNEQTFIEKGFQAWLELPKDSREIKDIGDKSLENAVPKGQIDIAKRAAKRFRIIIMPIDDETATAGHSQNYITPSDIPTQTETTNDEYKETPAADNNPSAPPAYSESNDAGASSPVSPLTPTEKSGPPQADPGAAAQYDRTIGFSNT
jgi:hypothetical protein